MTYILLNKRLDYSIILLGNGSKIGFIGLCMSRRDLLEPAFFMGRRGVQYLYGIHRQGVDKAVRKVESPFEIQIEIVH